MAKVKTLSEDVYRKIAAGEVVERPLSVVKELVENAIDAGADNIKIELAEGGKRLIKVTDNGSGFAPEDIETAFKNHSTSKLSQLEDLDSLGTLGFRGEALPSILEVSKIELQTSDNNDGSGIYCGFEDGQMLEQREIAFSRGSSIAVRELFYNFPVRKKFLKTDRTELNQIMSFLEPVTLVNYGISFELIHNGKSVFIYKKAETLKERIYQVFGKAFLDALTEMNYESGQYRLKGFISKINTGVSVKKHQYFFVNGRPVREKTLIASLNNTFQRYLEKSRNPVGVLLFNIPPHEVDVNIHPMKLEIKFVDSNAIYRFIHHGIDSTLAGVVGFDSQPTPGWGGPSGYSARPSAAPGTEGMRRMPASYSSDRDHRERGGGGYGGTQRSPEPEKDYAQAQLFAGALLNEEAFLVIGQYKNSYIIVEKNEELLIVDQHNAQERVNFDRLKKEYHSDGIVSITPLFPIIIELSPSEADRLDDEKSKLFQKMGFQLEPLSGNAFDVKSFPQVLEEKNIKDAVMEILHLQGDPTGLEDRILAEIACKSAIKINHKLFPDQMKTIVKNLFKTSNPYFCPHQRPIIIDFSLEKIEKMMKRR